MSLSYNKDILILCFDVLGQKRFKCDQCEFSCLQSFGLVRHKYIHGKEKPYQCVMCPKQFIVPSKLREHQRSHTGERPFVCEDCGKAFTQKALLKSHMVIFFLSIHAPQIVMHTHLPNTQTVSLW